MGLTDFLLQHGFLTEQEVNYLAEQYPGESPLAAAVSEGLLPAVIGQDIERLVASKKYSGLEPNIPGMLLLELVGEGAKGKVFRAWQEGLRRVIALKVLPRELLEAKEELSRFLREARIAAKLNHPALVRAYDVGQTKSVLYIVLEYVEGETLHELLKRESRLSLSRTCTICARVADGLAFAASKGIAHRDIKPANIQLSRHGAVKILDLGLARPEGESTLTQPLMVHGTPAYVSPEQARGEAVLTPKVDVYSLGVLLYRCVSGRHPVGGDSPREVLTRQVNERPARLDTFVKGLPIEFVSLVDQMLAKDPAKRPEAALVAEKLRELAGDREKIEVVTSLTSMLKTRSERTWFQSKGFRFAAVGTLLVIVSLILAIVFVASARDKQSQLQHDLEQAHDQIDLQEKLLDDERASARAYARSMDRFVKHAPSEASLSPLEDETPLDERITRAVDENDRLFEE